MIESNYITFLQHLDEEVRKLAVTSLGLCCSLDKNLAKQHIFHTFFVQLTFEQFSSEIRVKALNTIFDLLNEFGLSTFGIVYDETEEIPSDHEKTSRQLYTSFSDSAIMETEDQEPPSSSVLPENYGTRIISFLIGLLESGVSFAIL